MVRFTYSGPPASLGKIFCQFVLGHGFGGTLLASRVIAEELMYSSHLILKLGDALAVAISCSFSKLSSGDIEFNE